MNEDMNTFDQGSQCNSESLHHRYEENILDAVIELVVHALDVGYRDRRIVSSLLRNNLRDKFLGRDSLLDHYLNNELRKMLTHFKDVLDLPDDLDINHRYATHARLSDVVDAIENKYCNKNE